MTFSVPLRLISAVLFMTVETLAQQSPTPDASKPAPPAEITFATCTELVTVPVVVTDKSGKHLTGLKQSDFVIEENRHPRPIAHFEEVSTAASPFETPAPYAFSFSNFASIRQEPRRVTIIVLDLLNTRFFNQTNAREQLVKFLNARMQDSNPTSLTLLTNQGLRLVHSFTTDPAILVDALKRVGSSFSASDKTTSGQFSDLNSTSAFDASSGSNLTPSALAGLEAMRMEQILAQRADASYAHMVQRDQTLITLYALQELAQSAAGIPGRKSVIWASGGLPFILNDPDSLMGIDTTLMSDYEQTWKVMNDANVAVYPVDAHGLVAPDIDMQSMTSKNTIGGQFPGTKGGRSQFSIDPAQNLQDSLRAFANATGGKACYNRNDLDQCFALAAEDASQYYMLTYYLPADDRARMAEAEGERCSAAWRDPRARTGLCWR